MSKATKKKHVTNEVLNNFVLPEPNQQITRVLSGKGNNLHEVEAADGRTFLVSMPTKFRKNVWIKRGDYVIVEPIEEGDKVKAEIITILFKDQIKYIKSEGKWPPKFEECTSLPKEKYFPDVNSDDDYDETLVYNVNRMHTLQKAMDDSGHNTLPASSSSYSTLEYWNRRFEEENQYDWLLRYGSIQTVLGKGIQRNDRILMLGCGNSLLSEEMFEDGYRNITNIDYSSVVIKKMAVHCDVCSKMKWLQMDAKELGFPDGSFEVVIEKAMIDSFLVKENDPWNVSQDSLQNLEKILSEISRVLADNGRFISVSFSQPHFRGPLYANRNYGWSFSKEEIGTDFHYYVYLMQKGHELKNDRVFVYKPPTISQVGAFCSHEKEVVEDNFLVLLGESL